jgi:transposase
LVQIMTNTAQFQERWLSKRKIARHYDYSERTVNRWVAAGCPSRMIGGERRFRISEVDAWLDQMATAADEQIAA